MRARVAVYAAMLILSILPLPAQGVGGDGTDPGPAAPVLYAHVNSASFEYWISTLKEDADHTGNGGYNPLGWVSTPVDSVLGLDPDPAGAGEARWDMPFVPDVTAPVQLGVGQVEFKIYLGSEAKVNGNPVPTPTHASLTVRLTSGETIIAEKVDPTVHSLESQSWKEIIILADVTSPVIAANEPLVFTLIAKADPPFMGQIILGMSGETWTQITLPFGTGAGVPSFALSGPAEAPTIASGSSGTLAFTVRNSGNADGTATMETLGLPEGFEASFDQDSLPVAAGSEAPVSLTVKVPAGTPEGPVTFQVKAGDPASQATLDVTIQVAAAPTGGSGGGATTSPAATTTSAPAATTSSDEAAEPAETSDEPEQKDTPGIGAILTLLGLAAIVVVARRRN